MTVTQTVDIPVSHKLTIDVPREVPNGQARIIIQFPDKKESQLQDIYAGIPSKLDDDLLQSQLNVLEKVDW